MAQLAISEKPAYQGGSLARAGDIVRIGEFTTSSGGGWEASQLPTGSMGRLTLNILLSFAEFERQMIADRTRDKMAAARRKGNWVGGRPVLGYDIAPGGGKLLVNVEETALVIGRRVL